MNRFFNFRTEQTNPKVVQLGAVTVENLQHNIVSAERRLIRAVHEIRSAIRDLTDGRKRLAEHLNGFRGGVTAVAEPIEQAEIVEAIFGEKTPPTEEEIDATRS